MNQPDQLPALQDRGIEYATKAGYRLDEANFHRVFYAYCAGFTDGSSAERARADALQAELTRITSDRDAKTARMWGLGKRADALEAALREFVRGSELMEKQERGWGATLGNALVAARALLEKPQ